MRQATSDFTATVYGVQESKIQTANGLVDTYDEVLMPINALHQTILVQRRVQEARLNAVLTSMGFPGALEYLDAFNSGVNNGYHSTGHCKGVAHTALEIFPSEFLSNEEQAGILLGAVFHDFNHTAANVPDLQNIELAIAGLKDYRSTLIEPTGIAWANFDLIFQIAEDCIRITEYPFVKEPHGQCEQIIRDADMLYACTNVDTIAVMEGLREELEDKLDKKISLDEMLEGQSRFLESAKFYTPVGQAMFKAAKGPSLNLLRAYVADQNKQAAQR